jgi:hypothetical protein
VETLFDEYAAFLDIYDEAEPKELGLLEKNPGSYYMVYSSVSLDGHQWLELTLRSTEKVYAKARCFLFMRNT